MPPIAAAMGSAALRRRREVPNGELAFDLEPHDQEEHREQRVVDPVQQRHAEIRRAETQAQRRLPQRRERVARAASS